MNVQSKIEAMTLELNALKKFAKETAQSIKHHEDWVTHYQGIKDGLETKIKYLAEQLKELNSQRPHVKVGQVYERRGSTCFTGTQHKVVRIGHQYCLIGSDGVSWTDMLHDDIMKIFGTTGYKGFSLVEE